MCTLCIIMIDLLIFEILPFSNIVGNITCSVLCYLFVFYLRCSSLVSDMMCYFNIGINCF